MTQLQHVRGCFGCSATSPASLGIQLSRMPDGAEGRVCFGAGYEGAPGLVHGGLLATFADEVMGYVEHGANEVRLTAEMTIRYRRPTPIGTDLLCRARPGPLDGRRFTMHAAITAADDESTVLAEVDATYVLVPDTAATPPT